MRFFLTRIAALAAISLLFSITSSAQEHDFLRWKKGDAEKIVRRSTSFATESTSTWLVKGLANPNAPMKNLRALWLTNPTMKALIRLEQLDQRRSDEWALMQYNEAIKERTGYTFVVYADDTILGPLNVNVRSKETVFLQHRKHKDRFSRPMDTATAFSRAWSGRFARLRFREILFFTFDKLTDSEDQLITRLDDEIELQVPTLDSGTFTFRYKVKNLVKSLDEL